MNLDEYFYEVPFLLTFNLVDLQPPEVSGLGEYEKFSMGSMTANLFSAELLTGDNSCDRIWKSK